MTHKQFDHGFSFHGGFGTLLAGVIVNLKKAIRPAKSPGGLRLQARLVFVFPGQTPVS